MLYGPQKHSTHTPTQPSPLLLLSITLISTPYVFEYLEVVEVRKRIRINLQKRRVESIIFSIVLMLSF